MAEARAIVRRGLAHGAIHERLGRLGGQGGVPKLANFKGPLAASLQARAATDSDCSLRLSRGERTEKG